MDKGKLQLAIIMTGIGILVLAGLVAIYLFWPKHTWYETYRPDDKQPYGGYVFNELLKTYNPGGKYQMLNDRWDSSSVITDSNQHNSNYVFIGTNCYLDSLSAISLAAFVKRGNNALIIAPNIPYEMLARLGIRTCDAESDTTKVQKVTSDTTTVDTIIASATDTVITITDTSRHTGSTDTVAWNTTVVEPPPIHHHSKKYKRYSVPTGLYVSSVNLNYIHSSLKDIQGYIYNNVRDKDTVEYTWNYIVSDDSCNAFKFPYSELGTIGNEHINFIRVKYGAGNFLFHTTPMAFANYNLVDKKRLEYAEKALSHLANGNVYWDEYSRTYHMIFNEKMAADRDETPLRYILSQPSLRWAWYLLLAMVLLYTLFQLKRKQRVIPVLETNANTSIEFAQTISRLYFQQNDHRKLALQQMRLFLSFIRSRYHINTTLEQNLLIGRIVAKSGLPGMDVSMIFGQYIHIEQMPDINETQLIEFHQALENFYKKCK